jgi:hypothetical protein
MFLFLDSPHCGEVDMLSGHSASNPTPELQTFSPSVYRKGGAGFTSLRQRLRAWGCEFGSLWGVCCTAILV